MNENHLIPGNNKMCYTSIFVKSDVLLGLMKWLAELSARVSK